MLRTLLQISLALLAITIVAIFLSLVVGQIIPADVLSTIIVTGNNQYLPDTTNFILIDLNRHIRVYLHSSIETLDQLSLLQRNGQEALIQTYDSESHFYHYNLLTNQLTELALTYTEPDTGEVFAWDGVYSWLLNGDTLWDYNMQNGGIYRLEIASNTLQRVVPLVDTSASGIEFINDPFPSFSPSGTQVAFVSQSIYILNTDGSNIRQSPNTIDNAVSLYSYWSPQDERYLYITGYIDTPSAPMFFRVFDVNSGEMLATTQDLEGYSFSPCAAQNEWLSYVSLDGEPRLFNYLTGEAVDLSLVPELAGQPIEDISWFNHCNWLLVAIGDSTNMNSISVEYQPLYLVSRDGQTVYSLGEAVAYLSFVGDDGFLMAENQGAASIVYEIHFDGALQRTAIGTFIYTQDPIIPLYHDPLRFLIYNGLNTHVSLFNVRTGILETYFSEDESIAYSVYWRWE